VSGRLHGTCEGFAVGFAQGTVGPPKYFGPFPLGAFVQSMNVSSRLDLLAEGQVLHSSDDGFQDAHRWQNNLRL
jgi:hypothetical protein